MDDTELCWHVSSTCDNLGTFQSTLTDFPYLRHVWKKNTEEERLLGVSITGILDCPLLNNVDDSGLKIDSRACVLGCGTNKELLVFSQFLPQLLSHVLSLVVLSVSL